MIQLALVVGIGLLIFRVIWILVSLIQSLFVKKQITDVGSTEKEKTDNKSTKAAGKKDKIPEVTQMKKETEKKNSDKPISSSKPESKSKQSSEVKMNDEVKERIVSEKKEERVSSSMPKVEEVREKPKTMEEKVQSTVQVPRERQIFSNSQKQIYEQKILQLSSEIENYKSEKLNYIKKIEEIIEHIINERQQSRIQIEEKEDSSIANLKSELNAATQKMRDQQNQLKELFEKQKQYIIKSYEEQLQECKANHSDQITQYVTTIDEITQRLYQLEEEKAKKNSQSEIPPPENNNDELIRELKEEKEKSMALINKVQERENRITELERSETDRNKQIDILNQQLITQQNDAIEQKTKLIAQIHSLTSQQTTIQGQLEQQRRSRFTMEQKFEEEVFKHQHDKIQAEETTKAQEIIEQLEKELNKQKYLRGEEERKTSQTIEELKFCQEQLKNAKQTEGELRTKLTIALESPKKPMISKEDIEKHPEFVALKRKIEQLEGKKITTPENKSSILQSYPSPRETRELSPTFPISGGNQYKKAISPQSELKGAYKSTFIGAGKQEHLVPATTSTIMIDRRYKTPSEKPIVSTYFRQGSSGTYLGETNILNEAQRNLIIHEVSALKKITIRKTSLLYTSANKPNKPVTQYLVGVPNLLVIVELANKSIIGAFTQNAFTKANQFSHSTIMSKAMIFSILPQTFIVNEHKGEAIHFEDNILTWGREEIVINCNEPMTMNAHLNCEDAVYSSAISTEEFMGGESENVPIVKIEAYRNFFG